MFPVFVFSPIPSSIIISFRKHLYPVFPKHQQGFYGSDSLSKRVKDILARQAHPSAGLPEGPEASSYKELTRAVCYFSYTTRVSLRSNPDGISLVTTLLRWRVEQINQRCNSQFPWQCPRAHGIQHRPCLWGQALGDALGVSGPVSAFHPKKLMESIVLYRIWKHILKSKTCEATGSNIPLN